MTRLLVVGALAACTYPEKTFDGPLTCIGDAPPTKAKAVVVFNGTALNPADRMPLPGASISLQASNMTPIAGPITSDATTGAFQFSLTSNGTPVDNVQFYATGTDRYPTYYVPRPRLTEDHTFDLNILPTLQANNFSLGAFGMPLAANTAMILMEIFDCNNVHLANATVTSIPAGTVRYLMANMPSMTATQTDAGGVAMIGSLPPGPVTVTIQVEDVTLEPRNFYLVAGSILQPIMVP